MGWYRVEILKDNKVIKAILTLSDNVNNAITDIKEEYPQYANEEYKINCILKYDGH